MAQNASARAIERMHPETLIQSSPLRMPRSAALLSKGTRGQPGVWRRAGLSEHPRGAGLQGRDADVQYATRPGPAPPERRPILRQPL